MPKQGSGIEVKVVNNNIDVAIKKLKNKVKKYGLSLILAEKSAYKKPSAIKRENKLKAISRNKLQKKVDD